MLEILDTKIATAEENMQKDADLLESLNTKNSPILHLYEWKVPSISYGYFIKPDRYLNILALKEKKIDFARRPTGGGIVFHIWDYAFSFLMPNGHSKFSINTLENYHFVNSIVLDALKSYLFKNNLDLIGQDFKVNDSDQVNFCMSHPTKYDVVIDGKKVAGASQRKTNKGYLHQGTISIGLPKRDLIKDVLLNENILPGMLKYSYAPLGSIWNFKMLSEARNKIKEELIQKFQSTMSK